MQGAGHVDWTESSGRCCCSITVRGAGACSAAASPFATGFPLFSSSSFPSHRCLFLQGGSEKRLQFSTRLPRRNARWMRMRGRTGLPITWVSPGRLGPETFLECVGGEQRAGPRVDTPDSGQTQNPAAQPSPTCQEASTSPGGYGPRVGTVCHLP